MNDEVVFLPPTYDVNSRFFPATREWHVSMRVFTAIQDNCRVDPLWTEHWITQHTGRGELKLVVVL